MRKILLILFLILGIAGSGYCYDVNVSLSEFTSSSSQAIVQTACDTVRANGGGNVYLPAGTSYNWTSVLNLRGTVNLIGCPNPNSDCTGTAAPMTARQDITAYSQTWTARGKWLPEPQTVIKCTNSSYSIATNYPGITTGSVRISQIKFIQGTGSPNSYITQYNNTTGFRIDHCDFNDASRPLYLYAAAAGTVESYGVVDHCNFNGVNDYAINIDGRFGTWVDEIPLGMSNDKAMYVEDCFFTKTYAGSGHPVGSFCGAKWVFRYNTILQTPGFGQGGIDAHGSQLSYGGSGPGCWRGGGPWEIYNNYIIADPASDYCALVAMRSSYGVVHNNNFFGTKHAAVFQSEAGPCPGSCPATDPPRLPVLCNQDFPSYSGVPGSTIYRGGIYVWNNVHDSMTTSGPFYLLNATCNSVGCDISALVQLASSCVDSGKDLYGFNNGVSADTGCPRPSYTAYTYPHPLTGGIIPPVTVPKSPTGLRIQ
jgi:hypothetical protein